MDSDDVKRLLKAAPRFYGDVHFGFQCGSGWVPILERLGRRAEPTGFKAVTVKEKFGGLRVYTDYTNDVLSAAIREAESESLVTCESCGSLGRIRSTKRGWVYVSCDGHAR